MIRIDARPHRASPAPIAARLRQMLALSRQRRDLARLDPHLLDDIGVARDAAVSEARRMPWEAPGRCLR